MKFIAQSFCHANMDKDVKEREKETLKDWI